MGIDKLAPETNPFNRPEVQEKARRSVAFGRGWTGRRPTSGKQAASDNHEVGCRCMFCRRRRGEKVGGWADHAVGALRYLPPSKAEWIVWRWLKEAVGLEDAELHYEIDGRQVDVFVPSLGLAFEVDVHPTHGPGDLQRDAGMSVPVVHLYEEDVARLPKPFLPFRRDVLGHLLVLQGKLKKRLAPRYRIRWEDANGRYDPQVEYLKEQLLMLVAEATEALDALPWKAHKQEFGRPATHEELTHFTEECIDMLHFVLNCLLEVGVNNPETVRMTFISKAEVNHERQDRKY